MTVLAPTLCSSLAQTTSLKKCTQEDIQLLWTCLNTSTTFPPTLMTILSWVSFILLLVPYTPISVCPWGPAVVPLLPVELGTLSSVDYVKSLASFQG